MRYTITVTDNIIKTIHYIGTLKGIKNKILSEIFFSDTTTLSKYIWEQRTLFKYLM